MFFRSHTKRGDGGPVFSSLNLGENVSEQGKASLALEALKEGGQEYLGIVSIREILKEVAPALEKPQTPADASFKPQ